LAARLGPKIGERRGGGTGGNLRGKQRGLLFFGAWLEGFGNNLQPGAPKTKFCPRRGAPASSGNGGRKMAKRSFAGPRVRFFNHLKTFRKGGGGEVSERSPENGGAYPNPKKTLDFGLLVGGEALGVGFIFRLNTGLPPCGNGPGGTGGKKRGERMETGFRGPRSAQRSHPHPDLQLGPAICDLAEFPMLKKKRSRR